LARVRKCEKFRCCHHVVESESPSFIPETASSHPWTGFRTIIIEQSAWLATNSATLPSRMPTRPVCPGEPKTIKSAFHWRAIYTILFGASPLPSFRKGRIGGGEKYPNSVPTVASSNAALSRTETSARDAAYGRSNFRIGSVRAAHANASA
jgi:hypothetical protein